METKYMFKIKWDEVTTENIQNVWTLWNAGKDGMICKLKKLAPEFGDRYVFEDGKDWLVKCIKNSWLTEIKEPLSFEEWDKTEYENVTDPEYTHNMKKGNLYQLKRSSRKEGWNAALENQKLRVVDHDKDVEALDKLLDDIGAISGPCHNPKVETVIKVWKAALKYARGIS